MKQLINPHSHSDYSLDGAAKVSQIVKRNKELGATYVSLTEHGNLNSVSELYKEAHLHDIKPIVGIELYVQPPFLDELKNIIKHELQLKGKLTGKSNSEIEVLVDKELKKEYVHLTVHFKDEWAYNYFTSLTPIMEKRAIIKFGERKPIITIEELSKASGHITICSGCIVGFVNRFLLPRKVSRVTRPDLAEKAYNLIREIAGDGNFYVEVMPHEVTHTWQPPTKDSAGMFVKHECTPDFPDGDLQKRANLFVLELAKKYNDPVIISLDSHYATKEQKIVQDARLGNGQEQWKFYNNYHIMSSDEAYAILHRQINVDRKTFEEWIDNSYKWASNFDNFTIKTNKDRWILQPLPEDYKSRIISIINTVGRMNWHDPEMVQRLKYEIDILSNNGKINLLSYFFTVNDIANFCRSNNILINVRGSAGGSLLLYVLGVSAINPLKHNLSFERFLTLGRIKANTLPDVDIDVSDQSAVMDYLQNKYGDSFCRISVDVGLKLKSAIKDAERAVIGEVTPETEKLCVTLPKPAQGVSEESWILGYQDETGESQPGIIETYEPLKKYIQKNPQIWQIVKEMLGVIRQKSQHACGVVITDKPVQEYIPITYIGNTRVTGYSPKSLEYVGLVKYDILGLNTLRDINIALNYIKQENGIDIDPFNLPYDENVFKMLNNGETETVFQFDTSTVRPYIKAIKPMTIDGLAAVTALCRPGTLDAPSGIKNSITNREYSLAELYVKRANGDMPIVYVHPDLEPILKETYGIQLYQEQTLQIFRDLAGYSYEQAETVRRGIGKKDEAVLASCMGDLRNACLLKGWTEEQVNLLIDQIMASARYAFNKSHAVSYAYVAYACAYLKYHYPIEWWAAILHNASKDDIKKFYSLVNKYIKMPDVNLSDENFKIIKDENGGRKILAPLYLIDGVGQSAVKEIVDKRPFKDFNDFFDRIDKSVINKRIIERLIMAGVLDPLFSSSFTLVDKLNALYTKRNLYGFKDKHSSDHILNLTRQTEFNRHVQVRKIYSVYTVDWTDLAIKAIKRYCNSHSTIKNFYITENYQYGELTIKMSGGIPLITHKNNGLKINDVPLLNSKQIKDDIIYKNNSFFAFWGYVLKESDFKYFNRNREECTARKYEIEIGDDIYEVVKFPPYGKTYHSVDKSYEDEVVLLTVKGQYNLVKQKYQMYAQSILSIQL